MSGSCPVRLVGDEVMESVEERRVEVLGHREFAGLAELAGAVLPVTGAACPFGPAGSRMSRLRC